MKIYYAGNPFAKEDDIPYKILPKLKQSFPNINFIELQPMADFPAEENLIIIDTVKGISKTKLFKDIDSFKTQKKVTVHDFDLGFHLKLMKKLNKFKTLTLIGIPQNSHPKKAFDELRDVIMMLFS